MAQFEMAQVDVAAFIAEHCPTGRISTHRSGDLGNGAALAVEVFGERASLAGSGLTAFAYLFRRFGPPFTGWDDHKDLAHYLLTTPDPAVLLNFYVSGSVLYAGVGYGVPEPMVEEFNAPIDAWMERFTAWLEQQGVKTEEERVALMLKPGTFEQAETVLGPNPAMENSRRWNTNGWQTAHPLVQRVCGAVSAGLQDLLRPVHIRDVAIDLFGRIPSDDLASRPPGAERSCYAGYPIPRAAMDAMLADRDPQ